MPPRGPFGGPLFLTGAGGRGMIFLLFDVPRGAAHRVMPMRATKGRGPPRSFVLS